MEKFSKCLGSQINVVARSLRLFLEKELSPTGVSPSQWMLLMALGENNNQVQTAIAKTVNLDDATVTRIIDKLAEMGLLERNQDISDRRAQIISLTDKGWKIYKEWSAIGNRVNQIATLNLTDRDKNKILKILAVIKNNLDLNSSR
jgi:DNA-binding MarR family transcriptional regulator